ncbi:MAG: DNA-3-methyladenine glycosylase I [Deltaproteobacteria bacterium]
MQAPTQIVPAGLADYLDVISRAVFQSGMSWRVVEAKWEGFREAFAGFDPAVVAAFTDDDVERLAGDTRIIRNRRKIEATISNAQAMLELEAQPGGFAGWLRSHSDFDATVAALRGEFRFLGDTGAYYFLYVVGEDVPSHDEWMKKHPQSRR